ncbi:MAG: hypothetical protein Q4D45_10135 [Lachnospiraceae bacterium]|nr:hypothetical protein [Lachnospiraceae bacterium]
MIIQQINKKFWRTFGKVFLEALFIVGVILIFLWMYQLSYYSFSNEPYHKKETQNVKITIAEKETIGDLAKKLEQAEIIENKYYLQIRYQCSDYHRYHLRAGEYQVTDAMGIDDLLEKFTGR